MNWERWARAAGIGFFLFTVAAFIVGGEPPKVRKTVRVVFYDLTDSTELGEQANPEALRALLARYFEQMKTIFLWYQGSDPIQTAACLRPSVSPRSS